MDVVLVHHRRQRPRPPGGLAPLGDQHRLADAADAAHVEEEVGRIVSGLKVRILAQVLREERQLGPAADELGSGTPPQCLRA
ncbi:hypothetical protein ACFU7Y_12895 [Kitasatospora sp. NPDC057542]|uniref:hypothetical protein n=1 Tax=Kitasatospora sp. NPDC057542 TaxID=3346162 RepID=UPI0036CCABF0